MQENKCLQKIFLCDINCRSCRICNKVCDGFEPEQCAHISRVPFVCNGCDKPRNKCSISTKYDYNAKAAHRMYTERLSASREGISLTKKQLHEIDAVVKPLILQGQSPYMIIANHPELGISVSTLYNYIDQGVLLTRNIDLKRKVKFKPRKVHNTQIKDRTVFIGRTYTDFKTSHSDELDFSCLFPVILTDRGVEFGNPDALKKAPDGTARTSIYYCDPMRSSQKGGIENVHTMLHMIIPKGTVFDELTQWDIRKCVDHINNAPRKALNGSTPYLEACKTYDEETITALQLRYVAPDDVLLTPKLLKH